MEAIYFGNARWRGNSGGPGGDPEGGGPWVGADLESGMYYGGGNVTVINDRSRPLAHDFVSLTLKGRADGFVLKGGDATSGKQTTMFDGPRPFEAADGGGVGASSGGAGAPVSLQKCTPGNSKQTWAFENDRKSIGSGGRCLDIVSDVRSRPSVWSQSRQDTPQALPTVSPLPHHNRPNRPITPDGFFSAVGAGVE